jgi:hypothetical protein
MWVYILNIKHKQQNIASCFKNGEKLAKIYSIESEINLWRLCDRVWLR